MQTTNEKEHPVTGEGKQILWKWREKRTGNNDHIKKFPRTDGQVAVHIMKGQQ